MQSIVRLYLTDDPIRHHATYSFVNAHPSSSISDLQNGQVMNTAYASYEDGYWLLDGKYKFMPTENAHIGYMSAGMTDELGQSVLPLGTIHVQFDQVFDMDEISIHGNEISNDYATRVLVRYLNSGTVLQELWINPNQVHYMFSNPITGVDEIHFAFYDTNKPYRRARVTGINYGDTVEFRGDQVEKGNVVMEQSPIITELPYGTFTSYLRSSEPVFDTIDPDSLYSQLKNRMMMDVLYDNNREVDFVNRYWMTKKEHVTDYQVQIEGMDLIGLLEDTPYNGDFWITNASFSTIINRILSFSNDVKTISIDSDVAEIQLHGNIAPGTAREALQQALFAAGCSAEIINGDGLYIFQQRFLDIDGTPTGTFTRAEKALDNQSMTNTTPVTKIELTSHSYAPGTTTVTVFNETLTGGTYTIQFDKPTIFTQSNVTNATLLDSGPNYAIIDVIGTKEVTITGIAFTPSQIVNTRDIDLSGVKPNIIKVQDATMVSPDSALGTLTRMQYFYLLRFQQQFRVFNPLWYRPGYIYRVDTIKDRQVAIIAERTEIDLSSGFVCDITGTGVVLGNVLIQKRDIVVDDKGSVTPTQFEYPRSGAQSFTAVLFADYQADYGIEIDIDGVKTMVGEPTASFVLSSTTGGTSVQVNFPVITKAIEYNPADFTITPARFRMNMLAEQNIDITSKKSNPALWYMRITINGQAVDYDIGAKTLVLSNTNTNTTVQVTAVEKSKKSIGWSYDDSTTGYDISGATSFYYPVPGDQIVTWSFVYWTGGQWNDAKADVKLWRDGVLVSSANQVSYYAYTLTNATSSTIVDVRFENLSGGSGGGGTGGGGGYTPWNALVYGNSIMRDIPSPGGNFVASLGGNTMVNVTNQSGEWFYGTITYNPTWQNTVGLSGWIHNSVVSNPGSSPN